MTRRQAHKIVKYQKAALGAAAFCPFCNKGGVVIRKPYTWGDVEKIKAKVVDHILEVHPEKEAV